MDELPAPPRDLIGEILEYVAATGTAALVRRSTGAIVRIAGDARSSRARFGLAAAMALDRESPVVLLDEGYVVGRAGLTHAVVVDVRECAADPLSAIGRVERACQTLAPFLPLTDDPVASDIIPPGQGTPSASGAPAQAVVLLPRARKPDPNENS